MAQTLARIAVLSRAVYPSAPVQVLVMASPTVPPFEHNWEGIGGGGGRTISGEQRGKERDEANGRDRQGEKDNQRSGRYWFRLVGSLTSLVSH